MQKVLSLIIVIVFLNCSESPSYSTIPNPATGTAKYPRLFTDNTGSVFMSWHEVMNDSVSLNYAAYSEGNWTNTERIQKGNSWFLNWADFQSIIAQDGEVMASHWLNKIPGNTYSYTVELLSMLSEEQITRTAHDDQTATEHGFVSLQPTSDTTFYAVWLDGRNTTGSHDSYGDLSTAMTVRGAEFDLHLNKLNEQEIDASTCDCCNTALSMTSNGLIMAYRDRTADEVRDIYVSRFIDGKWTTGTPVFKDNWQIAACPVNGPSIDSYENSTAIAWFTSMDDQPTVKFSFSDDGGTTFSDPTILNTGTTAGRVDVEFIDEQTVWVSWLNRTEESGEIVLQKLNSTGNIVEEFRIPDVDPGRSTGFPQITKAGETLLIAWTQDDKINSVIKTAIITL